MTICKHCGRPKTQNHYCDEPVREVDVVLQDLFDDQEDDDLSFDAGFAISPFSMEELTVGMIEDEL